MSVSDADVAVRVEDLAVTYRTPYDARPTLRRALGARRHRDVTALDGVDLDVGTGQVLGVVGGNGAGKSTLLRAMAGIVPPSRGRIEVAGQVTAILRPGAAFNARLSGHDNIVLGGLASGLTTSQVHERREAVVAFADIGEAIDAPLRTYSSGMVQRLSFAIAAHLDGDVLLLDEGLTAGDEAFRVRCEARMRTLAASDVTLVVVSHNLAQVRRLATRVAWLHHGRVREVGAPGPVLKAYRADSRA